MTTSVEVVGAQAMQSSLHAAAKKVQDLTPVNREVASTVASAVKAPRRSGRLAGSIRPEATATEARVVSDVSYAGVIENGWPKHNIRAQNFVKEAFANTQATTEAMYEKALQGVADDVKGA